MRLIYRETAPAGDEINFGESEIPDNITVEEFGLGHIHSCAVSTDNSLSCWGCNAGPEADLGQCEVPDFGGNVIQDVGGGTGHSCALDETGQIHCWGCGENWRWDLGQCESY